MISKEKHGRLGLSESVNLAAESVSSSSKLALDLLRRPDSEAIPLPLYHDVTQAVGLTPIVQLNRISPVCRRAQTWVKLESCNPGGSIKEKNAVYLINRAEQDGELLPGGTIVESSSGNFGVGLAVVGAARGYRVIIVIDAKTTPFFRRLLKAYGAELVEVDMSAADASGSMQKARMARARSLAESIPGAWYPCQHLNPNNLDAHVYFTAREIDLAFPNRLDAIVVGVSTAGQIMGVARYFKKRRPEVQIIGVDVKGSVIFSNHSHAYKMTGVGLSFRPPNLDYSLVDCAYVVSETLAFSVCHELAQREGMLLGASTGAIVAAGLHVADTLGDDSVILMVNADRGDRYLETIYNSEWLESHDFNLYDNARVLADIENLEPVYYNQRDETMTARSAAERRSDA